ncbi:hypothetical protein MNEG_14661, partial [Monoraphidium neglectum]
MSGLNLTPGGSSGGGGGARTANSYTQLHVRQPEAAPADSAPAPAPAALGPAEHRAQHEAALLRLAPAAAEALAGCASALVALGDASGVRGLREWGVEALAPLWKLEAQLSEFDFEPTEGDNSGGGSGSGALAWLLGLEAQAEGRLEDTAQLLAACVANSSGGGSGGGAGSSAALGSPYVQGVLMEHLADCYAALSDWQGLRRLDDEARSQSAALEAAARVAAPAAGPREPGAPPARHAAMVAARSAAALASVRRARAAILGSWATAGAEAPVGARALSGDVGGGGGGRGADSLIGACMACVQQSQGQQRQIEQAAHLMHACEREAPTLAERCAAAAWLGAAAARPALQQLAALQLLAPMLSGPGAAQAAATAEAAAAAARALLRAPGAGLFEAAGRDGSIAGVSWGAIIGDDGELCDVNGGTSGCSAVPLADLTRLLRIVDAGAAHPRQAAAWAAPRALLQLQVAVAARRGGAATLLERTLAAAEHHLQLCAQTAAPDAARELLWLRAVGARLRPECSGGAWRAADGDQQQQLLLQRDASQDAVSRHLALLDGRWPHQINSRPEGRGLGEAGGACGGESAAALMSLAALLRRTPAAAAAPAGVDWVLAYRRAMHLLAGRRALDPPASVVAAAVEGGLSQFMPESRAAALAACAASAAACAPQQPGPWRALGDLMHDLAEGEQQVQQQQQQQQHQEQQQQQRHDDIHRLDREQQVAGLPEGGGAYHDGAPGAGAHAATGGAPTATAAERLFALAADAYCRHLATAVASTRLASPEAGLPVLLRLLRLALTCGPALAAPLRASLGRCPAAAWQALAPQLLAALAAPQGTPGSGGGEEARGLAALLLRGVAAAAPCSVLYPCVAELRAAEDSGGQ